jgi:hypothetical protein
LISQAAETPTGRHIFDLAWSRVALTKIAKYASSPVLTIADISRRLSSGLLRTPYLAVERTGGAVPAPDFTSRRKVAGAILDGFCDAEAVRGLLDDGAAVVLPQASDWNAPVKRLTDALEAQTQCVLSPTAWWCTQPGAAAFSPRPDARVLLLQLAGSERWLNCAAPRAGVDALHSADSDIIQLDPGDLLCVPSGELLRHYSRPGESLYLALEMLYPTPSDLARALARLFADCNPQLIHHYHTKTLEQRATEVRTALRLTASGIVNSPTALHVLSTAELRRRLA